MLGHGDSCCRANGGDNGWTIKLVAAGRCRQHNKIATTKLARGSKASLCTMGHDKETRRKKSEVAFASSTGFVDPSKRAHRPEEPNKLRSLLDTAYTSAVGSNFRSAFKEARRLAYLDTQNSARLPSEASRKTASQNYAYTLQEILEILARLPEPAATVFAVAGFAGLRRSELEGLEWRDFPDGHRWVPRSIWNGEVLLPKTEMSACLLFRPLSHRRNGWTSSRTLRKSLQRPDLP